MINSKCLNLRKKIQGCANNVYEKQFLLGMLFIDKFSFKRRPEPVAVNSPKEEKFL